MEHSSSVPSIIRLLALGSASPLAQVSRIREGMASLPGIELVERAEDADIIYCNDMQCYDEALTARDSGYLKEGGKLVFNVLDIPEHCFEPMGDFNHVKLLTLRADLLAADAVTAISPFTRSQINRLLGLAATVIWNPTKAVSPDVRLSGNRPYPFRALIAGRAGDPNKRQLTLGIPALIAAGFEEHEVAVVGGEYPGWGTNLGVVSDGMLNDLYNSVDFLMHPSLNEGIGLSPLEAMACGAIPILTYDCSTFRDISFFPQYWGCYPSVTSLAYRLRALIDNPALLLAERSHCLESSEQILDQFSGVSVARRIEGVCRKVLQPKVAE